MDELNRYIAEAIRVRRTIQVYSELFDSREAIDVLSNKSLEFTAILKRSMHDEVLISLSRLFDTNGYKTQTELFEYLSQRNLVLKYESLLDENLKALRNKTTELWSDIEVKDYRDFKLAHNDKSLLCGLKESIGHNVSFGSAKELVETSIQLVLGIMTKTGQTSISVNLNEKYENIGRKFIESIKYNK